MFGRYLLVQRLSRGGMGEIFLAKHGLAGFEKLAVIKKVLPHLAADAQFISRFVDEAQVAIKLQHVNVAQVFEVGRVGDEYFLALEYVEGRDLRRTLGLLAQKKQRLPVDLALFIGRELANGLAYAHRRTGADGSSLNLVHCDISPPNVLVSFEGETKVIDFGIAKSAIRGTATDPKMGFGKFGYMAPEQLIRGGMVDHRTDIYAAGVVLFELLTGIRLYEAGPEPDYRGLAKKVAKGEHAMPSEVDKVLAPYDDLVATALRPKPEDRYQTAAEFRDAIQQCLVNVNPTISTDQLGAFMRELFADEMTAQRELHERVAKAHLADFQEQLTNQTGTTVSFALANLPLRAPEERDKPALPRPRTTPRKSTEIPVPPAPRPRPPTTPTEILPQAPPQPPPIPTGAIPTQELSLLADGTGAVPPEELSLPISPLRSKGRGRAIAIGSAVAIIVVGTIVFAMTRNGGRAKQPASTEVASAAGGPGGPGAVPPPTTTTQPQPQPQIRVEPINDPPVDAAQPATAVPPPPPVAPHATTPPHRHVGSSHRTEHPSERHAELTRDQVAGKFRGVKREYDNYKSQNGGRLDQDWDDLATFMQFQLRNDNLDEAVRRIDAFRAKMRGSEGN
ncbi:MAG TPA: serine/threonine-protein kinase [Kofleriaceae bacterium]|nr:serine/threonine-protein kinase [Kofleriaceae bacterium]